MKADDLLCSRNARPPKERRKDMGSFFAPGTRGLRRPSFDGRSQKLLTPLLAKHWGRAFERTRAVGNSLQPPSIRGFEQGADTE